MEPKLLKQAVRIAVVGRGQCSAAEYEVAYAVGVLLAQVGAVLICGGLGGTMEAASKGASDNGGLVIGIVPGMERDSANPYVNIPICTSLGLMRNFLVVINSDAVIALPGAAGTLSEMAYALQLGKQVVSVGSWDLPGVMQVDSATDAVAAALAGQMSR